MAHILLTGKNIDYSAHHHLNLFQTALAGLISFTATLAPAIVLVISSMWIYLEAVVGDNRGYQQLNLIWVYFRKRVGSRTIHNRKGALFAGNPDSRAGLSGTRQ